MIRVLIADHEPSARMRLRTLIDPYNDLRIVGECGTAAEAKELMLAFAPAIVFMDVQMPGGSPIDMLRAANSGPSSAVVLVASHNTLAADAFDVDATDYMLKPFSAARLDRALCKAREKLAIAKFERLGLRETGGRVVWLTPADIVWIEASANNLNLHLRSKKLEIRATLSSFCQSVERFGFTRIHRSFAINSGFVRALEPWSHGEYVVVMDDGTRLNTSRTFRANVAPLLDRTVA